MSGRCRLAGLAAAWLLAACEGPLVPPEAPRVERLNDVRVLRATGNGTIAYGTITAPLDPAAPDAPDARFEWQVQRSGTPLMRLSHEDLLGYDKALAAIDGGQRFWSAQNLPAGSRVKLCYEDLVVFCASVDVGHVPPLTTLPRMAQDLQASEFRGDAVLLLLGGNRWQTVWMRGGLNPQWQKQDLPESATFPKLMHGALGARAAWKEGSELQLWALSDATLTWQHAYTLRDISDAWAVAQQRGATGTSWIAVCGAGGPQVWRMLANSLRAIAAPSELDCSQVNGRPLLAVSDNGDAVLAWQTKDAAWHLGHWSEAGAAWSAALRLQGQVSPHRLVADEGGHFVLLSFDGGENAALRLRAYRPGAGWQEAYALEPPAVSDRADVAVSNGRAVVAWARATGTDDPGSRLASAVVNLATEFTELRVLLQGGLGRVTSTPAGIDCPQDCNAQLPLGSSVQLSAAAAAGHRFAGWSGGCSGAGLRIDVALVVGGVDCIARFEPQANFALTLATQGAGRASADPAAPDHPPGTVVTLTATPGGGQRFVAWGGDADCADGRLTMDGPRACTAVFEPDPGQVALTLSVNGGGRVLSTPAGLTCPGSCQAWFALGQSVVLSAEPPPGTNTRWSGACSAAVGLSATVVLGVAQQCGVDFELPPPSGWQALGGLLPGSGGIVGLPSIAADAQGVPTVAFIAQLAEFRELQVLRLVGGGWQRVGNGPLNDPLVSANEPSLALDGQGRPLVAFSDVRGRVQVRHWDGSRWRHLADDLSLTAGAITSSPQIAFDGQRAVVALLEYQGGRARPVLLRSALDTPAWTGSAVGGVQLDGNILLRLALDAAGQATLAHVGGSGAAGEQAPRVVQEGAAGWAQRCDGGAGVDPGTTYLLNQLGFGMQGAPDGASLVLRPSNDARAVQAWRCNGSGAWALDGPGGGALVVVDNVTNYLQAVAMGRTGLPTAAVLVSTGYAGTSELHAFVYGAAGFQSAGVPLVVASRGLLGVLGVALAATGSPVAAYGVEAVPGSRELRAARFHP